MANQPSRTILVLAPHTDDGEFGCGGTIARLVEEGNRVIYVAFSAAEQSVLPHLPKDILRHEVKEATKVLGIDHDDCIVLNYEVRRFPEFRQKILDDLIVLNKQFAPDTIFMPSQNDCHQDHLTIAQEGYRAFKRSTILGYEIPWNNLNFQTSCFFVLSSEHVAKKVSSLTCYKSQEHRNYASEQSIRSVLTLRGVQVGTEFAEAFEVIRWVNKLPATSAH